MSEDFETRARAARRVGAISGAQDAADTLREVVGEVAAGEWSEAELRRLPVIFGYMEGDILAAPEADRPVAMRTLRRWRAELGLTRPAHRPRVSDEEASERTLRRRRTGK